MHQHHSANMIFHIGKFSIYIAHKLKYMRFFWLPRYSYFDGISYFKLSFYWFHIMVEISANKKNKKVYEVITKEELDKILKKDIIKQ